tara:strand:+ start:886 stop:1161 length:276 start_codon:yes stop_codon:yes gene_type:complete
MTRKDWTLYTPFYSTDWPGSRRNDGSIVTMGDFYREAPMRQVFQYTRQQFVSARCNPWNPYGDPVYNDTQLNSKSIVHAMAECRRVYASRN